jgi:RNA polymerase sigma-70 factor, ECF subfamily
MALGKVDGETAVIILRDDADGLTPFSLIRLDVAGDRIVAIADYIKCPWVLEAAEFIFVSES